MKKIIYGALLLVAAGCTPSGQKSQGISLDVTVDGIDNGKLYLCAVNNVHYKTTAVIDTLQVEKGHATYHNDTLPTTLYALAPQLSENGYPLAGELFFMQPGETTLRFTVEPNRTPVTTIEQATPIQKQYEAFTKQMKAFDSQVDSINQLFYAARERGDREEMAKQKEASIPYYEKAETEKNAYIDLQLNEEQGSAFGLYLYYAYRFENQMVNSVEEINSLRTYLTTFNEEARRSGFALRIEQELNALEKCAIGHEAPEISGLTVDDKPIKLSDFRGKLVLVDFWSSTCGWCRKENVYLKPAYEKFKNQNFTILGVSSDYRKEEWLKAIEEDQTHWNHLLLKRDEIRNTLNKYCIAGIPHIILVSPEGIILEKELRGEAIEKAIIKHLGETKK